MSWLAAIGTLLAKLLGVFIGAKAEAASTQGEKVGVAETTTAQAEKTSEVIDQGARVRADADERVRGDTDAQLDADPHGHWLD